MAFFVSLNYPSSALSSQLSALSSASGLSSTLGGWIVTKQPNGHLVGFHWLGWIAVAGGLLSILLAHTVHMNDTGVASPLAPATKAT